MHYPNTEHLGRCNYETAIHLGVVSYSARSPSVDYVPGDSICAVADALESDHNKRMKKIAVGNRNKNQRRPRKLKVVAAARPTHDRVRLSVRVNDNKPEAMHLLGQRATLPEIGDIIKVLPERFQKAIFAKSVKVESISVKDGLTIFHATTGF